MDVFSMAKKIIPELGKNADRGKIPAITDFDEEIPLQFFGNQDFTRRLLDDYQSIDYYIEADDRDSITTVAAVDLVFNVLAEIQREGGSTTADGQTRKALLIIDEMQRIINNEGAVKFEHGMEHVFSPHNERAYRLTALAINACLNSIHGKKMSFEDCDFTGNIRVHSETMEQIREHIQQGIPDL
jgi:hypothetical protein